MNIALMAHDSKKELLTQFCIAYCGILSRHNLCATGTTGKLIAEATGLNIVRFLSGSQGGDQQIGARIVDGKIDIVIFFSDPLTAQPHDPDVKALLRIAQVFDIPMANNKATADFIITSDYMNTTYTHRLIDFDKSVRDRAEQLEEEEAEKEAEKK